MWCPPSCARSDRNRRAPIHLFSAHSFGKLSLLLGSLLVALSSAFAADCNRNGVDDLVDISNHTSADCNNNSKPDECDVSTTGFSAGQIIEIPLKDANAGLLFPTYLTPTGVADFNSDGAPDLWGYQNYFSLGGSVGLIFIYMNNGDNTFADPTVFRFDGTASFTSTFVGDAAVVDANGDNKLDIVYSVDSSTFRGVSSHSFSVNVIRNDGSGAFSIANTNVASLLPATILGSLGTKLIPASFASATSKDLALLYEGRLYALYQTAPFQYSALDLGTAAGARGLVVDPFGLSQRLVAFNNSSVIATVLNRGDGSLFRADSYSPVLSGPDVISAPLAASGLGPIQVAIRAQVAPSGAKPGSVSLALESPVGERVARGAAGGMTRLAPATDFDGDGKTDLVLFGSNAGEILLNDATGSFTQRVSLFVPSPLKTPIAIGEFNHDSKPDLLYVESNSSKAAIALNASTLPFTAAVATDLDADRIPDSCERAVPLDFDGDRRSDVTVVRTANTPYQWWYAPTSVENLTGSARSFSLGLQGEQIAAGDFDGDGKVEPGVIGATIRGLLVWSSLDQNGATQEVSFGSAGDRPLTGYFDSDRKLDRAVVRNVAGNLRWFILQSTPPSTVIQADFGLNGDTPFAADLDGDGVDELIVARNVGTEIVWFSQTLAGVAGPEVHWGLRGDTLLPPVDGDGDGKRDFAVARLAGGTIQIFARDLASSVGFLSTGLGADNLFSSQHSGLNLAEFGARDRLSSFVVSPVSLLSQGGRTFTEYFGFSSDTILTLDGTAAPAVGVRGALACQTILPFYDGPGGYRWNGAVGKKSPSYFVPPSLVSQIRSMTLLTPGGAVLDSMSRKSKKQGKYSSKKYKLPKLIARGGGDNGAVVQTQLKSGAVLCEPLPFLASDFD